jgi:ParB/RepB/Spo0J family partition protein
MKQRQQQLSIPVPEVFRTEEIDLDRIVMHTEMKESACANIARSLSTIKQVLQPVLVMEEGEGYRLIFGRRRVFAAQKEGFAKILATIVQKGTPEEVLAMYVLVENCNRSFNPASEAESLSTVMTAYNWSPADVTRKLGIPAAHVASRIKLFKLIPEFFQKLKEGEISFSLAKTLCKLSAEMQRDLLLKEKLTLEEVEDIRREVNIGNLIPDALFKMPENAGQKSVSAFLQKAISNVEEAIAMTTNGKKGKMERALKLLREV